MITFPELCFYAEAEGLLPTRTGKINAVINDIKNYPASSIDFAEFELILKNNGLCYDELTASEIDYIHACIAR